MQINYGGTEIVMGCPMTAKVIQIRDYQPKHDLARLAELERQAVEIMNVALMGEPGMCGMEPVIYVEIPHYHAPEKDPA